MAGLDQVFAAAIPVCYDPEPSNPDYNTKAKTKLVVWIESKN